MSGHPNASMKNEKQKEAYLQLLAETVKKMDKIDNDTWYQTVEPSWWLDMMEVQRLMRVKLGIISS